jgi:hypothetical protein
VILDDGRDWLRNWQEAERYLGLGTRDYSSFSARTDVSPEYHPQLGRPWFEVPSFRIPAGRGRFVRNGVRSTVVKLYSGSDCFLLPVHPETLACDRLPERDYLLESAERGPDLTVVPSANTRTVFVERIGGEPVEPHFVKLHYPKRLSRFTRRLRLPIISVQLWVAEELMGIGAPVLPEVAAGVLGERPGSDWGFLIREARPRAVPEVGPYDTPGGAAAEIGASPPAYTVPLFALYGRDFRAPGDPTLLEQLVARSGEEPSEWLVRRVVIPMVTLWVRSALTTGCMLELHGQNTLFGYDRDARHTAVLYRDCSVYIDPLARRALGLDRELPPANVISHDVRQRRENVYSLTYDSFMGHHALERLAGVADETLGVPPRLLREAARETFARYGGAAVPLPETVYYYENRLHPESRWNLVDTGERPAWRTP